MRDQLQSYPSFIIEITKYEHHVDGDLEQFKAIALLIDGSRLHINEVWLDNILHKYAYYWLDLNRKVIQGWDNAPHHSHIATYPHHTHLGGEIVVSYVRSLLDLLEILDKKFSDKSSANSKENFPD